MERRLKLFLVCASFLTFSLNPIFAHRYNNVGIDVEFNVQLDATGARMSGEE
jgi:hypothetical protein